MRKTYTKNFLACNPIVNIGKRKIATQLTKCGGCQKNKLNFFDKN